MMQASTPPPSGEITALQATNLYTCLDSACPFTTYSEAEWLGHLRGQHSEQIAYWGLADEASSSSPNHTNSNLTSVNIKQEDLDDDLSSGELHTMNNTQDTTASTTVPSDYLDLTHSQPLSSQDTWALPSSGSSTLGSLFDISPLEQQFFNYHPTPSQARQIPTLPVTASPLFPAWQHASPVFQPGTGASSIAGVPFDLPDGSNGFIYLNEQERKQLFGDGGGRGEHHHDLTHTVTTIGTPIPAVLSNLFNAPPGSQNHQSPIVAQRKALPIIRTKPSQPGVVIKPTPMPTNFQAHSSGEFIVVQVTKPKPKRDTAKETEDDGSRPPQTHPCTRPGCGSVLKTARGLVYHLKRHDNPPVKNHVCSEVGCTYATDRRATLIRHRAIHSTNYPFVCKVDGCDLKYKSTSGFRRHMQKQHGSRITIKVVKRKAGPQPPVFN